MTDKQPENTETVVDKLVEKVQDVFGTSSDDDSERSGSVGFGRDASANFPDASIQPSSDDTPPTAGGIDAAPHMGDDDALVPVGPDDAGPRVTPSTAGETPDVSLERPATAGAFETDPRGSADDATDTKDKTGTSVD